MAQLPGLRDVNSDLQISNPQWRVDIDRDKAAAFGVTTDAGAHRALRRLRHAPDLDHLHRGRRLPGDPRGERQVPGRLRRARPHPRLDADRPARAARRGGDDAAHRWTAADQPPVAAAGGDDLVQSRARHVARPGDRGHPRGRAQGRPAGQHHHRLRRQRPAVRAGARRPGRAADGGGADDLHPARRALRELHPPDHDSLRPALGRHRRAAGAEDTSTWTCRSSRSSAFCC